MFDSGDIKMQARNALQNNWGSAVLVSFLCGIMGIVFVLTGPVSTGQCKCYLDRIRNRGPVNPLNIENLLVYFDGRFFGGTFLLWLLQGLYLFLWALLLWIPAFIKAYSYSMSHYIMVDNPYMSANECIEESRRMMNGHKGSLFMLHLSFIGWMFLCIFTFGIGALFLIPYMEMSNAAFYDRLRVLHGKPAYDETDAACMNPGGNKY